MVSIVTRQWAG